jgi:hypothetical protein
MPELPDCHQINEKMLQRFLRVRAFFKGRLARLKIRDTFQQKKKGSELGSKSMAMRQSVENVK